MINQSFTVKQLPAELITPEAFKPYGQIITPSLDGKLFDGDDAQLDLSRGTPRFYLMHLHQKDKKFHTITRHLLCTQCLGALNGQEWLIVVCPSEKALEPNLNQIKAFRISGNCFIKLEVGTWHTGPYFNSQTMNFYNLELHNTNIVDHFTYSFLKEKKLKFEIVNF